MKIFFLKINVLELFINGVIDLILFIYLFNIKRAKPCFSKNKNTIKMLNIVIENNNYSEDSINHNKIIVYSCCVLRKKFA